MNIGDIALIYLALINVVTFFTYGVDKSKAASKRGQVQTGLSHAERKQARTKFKAASKQSRRRIRETTLLGLAVLGGSVGAWLGMKVWHHKTLHKKFKYGVPAILVIHLAIIGYILIRYRLTR